MATMSHRWWLARKRRILEAEVMGEAGIGGGAETKNAKNKE
jgi:hypothetical protein